MAHHTILLGPRYRALLRDIFSRHVLADDFSLYLHRPTATDPSLAPPGCDAFYVLSPVPHLDSGTDWAPPPSPTATIARALSDSVLPGLQDAIVSSRMMTPQDFQDRLLSYQGAAFGLEPLLTQSAWFRPHNEARRSRASTSSAPAPIPARGCPACCLPRVFSTRSCPMPVPQIGLRLSRPCRLPRADARRLAQLLLRVPPAAAPRGRAGDRAVCVLPAGRRLVDEGASGQTGRRRAGGAAGASGRAYAGTPEDQPADRALAAVVARHGLPRALPTALLEGFAWDAQGRRYETLDALRTTPRAWPAASGR